MTNEESVLVARCSIPIEECGEAMKDIPRDVFAFFEPHPYVALGAGPCYGGMNPWRLRASVLAALTEAQRELQRRKAGWKIKIFDTWRPNAVQIFMVEKCFKDEARRRNLDPENLSEEDKENLAPHVYTFWSVPSEDPASPPAQYGSRYRLHIAG